MASDREQLLAERLLQMIASSDVRTRRRDWRWLCEQMGCEWVDAAAARLGIREPQPVCPACLGSGRGPLLRSGRHPVHALCWLCEGKGAYELVSYVPYEQPRVVAQMQQLRLAGRKPLEIYLLEVGPEVYRRVNLQARRQVIYPAQRVQRAPMIGSDDSFGHTATREATFERFFVFRGDPAPILAQLADCADLESVDPDDHAIVMRGWL